MCVCCAYYLFQRCQNQRDVLGIQQALGHERETRARILLHLIIALINLHRGNLQGERNSERDGER